MSKHTPGPWKWRNLKGSTTKCELVGADGSVIYVAESADGGVPADDDLIESAPELLEALKLCAGVCAGETLSKSSLVIALQKARAAIAKATGEQP